MYVNWQPKFEDTCSTIMFYYNAALHTVVLYYNTTRSMRKQVCTTRPLHGRVPWHVPVVLDVT